LTSLCPQLHISLLLLQELIFKPLFGEFQLDHLLVELDFVVGRTLGLAFKLEHELVDLNLQLCSFFFRLLQLLLEKGDLLLHAWVDLWGCLFWPGCELCLEFSNLFLFGLDVDHCHFVRSD